MATSTHLPPPVMMESTELLRWVTHMLCWTWAMYFSAAASSENDQGSMNLASNTASVPSTIPSSVAAIHGIAECLTRRWTSRICRSLLRSYQERLSSSVALPSCTMRLPDRSSGSASPRFSRHRRTRAASSLPMMIRASELRASEQAEWLIKGYQPARFERLRSHASAWATMVLLESGEQVLVLDNLTTGFDWAVPPGATL